MSTFSELDLTGAVAPESIASRSTGYAAAGWLGSAGEAPPKSKSNVLG